MSITQLEDGAVIGKVRASGSFSDPLATRLRLSRLLESADLRPAGMPPSAILLVRSVADPLPGHVTPHVPRARIDPTWERAARGAVGEMYRRAARPVRGELPANAEAVLFADEGEMLACLVLDISRHRDTEGWWWRSIPQPPRALAGSRQYTLLAARAAAVPAALHHLAGWRQALSVVGTLSTAEAMNVLLAVIRAHHLPDLALDMPGASPPSAVERPRQSGKEHGLDPVLLHESPAWPEAASPSMPARDEPEANRARTSGGQTVPWEEWLPAESIPPALGRERICLLGVGLTVHRAPWTVRSGGFLRVLRAWWTDCNDDFSATAAAPPEAAPPLRKTEAARRRDVARASHTETAPLEIAGGMPDPPAPPDDRLETRAPTGAPADRDRTRPRALTPENDLTAVGPRMPAGVVVDGEMRPTGPRDPTSPTVSGVESKETPRTAASPEKHQPAGPAEPHPWWEGGVSTHLGGVLYLINAMVHLDLPSCFEEEWRLGSEIGPWGSLEILARGLLTRDADTLFSDPLWTVLAHLDGREAGELPGTGFTGSRSFQLPPMWHGEMAAEERGTYAWAGDGLFLRLWSHRGYMLVERAHDGRAGRDDARDEMRAYDEGGRLRLRAFHRAPVADVSGRLLWGLNDQLARWLGLVLPYLRLRLCGALRIRRGDRPDLDAALLRRPGQIYVTSTHLDVVMALDEISLPVRLAGLDRDPGWMPDFGRVVKFHFE